MLKVFLFILAAAAGLAVFGAAFALTLAYLTCCTPY